MLKIKLINGTTKATNKGKMTNNERCTAHIIEWKTAHERLRSAQCADIQRDFLTAAVMQTQPPKTKRSLQTTQHVA